MFEINELKKYLLPTHVTLYMCKIRKWPVKAIAKVVTSRTSSFGILCFANDICHFNKCLWTQVFSAKLKSQTTFSSIWLCYKERMVDALALRADERRDKLRKASGRSKYPMIRRYLNGETWRSKPPSLHDESIVMQGEPGELKHLSSRRKRKKHRFPK